ncbi:MAG: serine/threonine-protein kinase, partial [Gammaproteobacteria bacterium]|nr:serine/threonine-protein kinase [Gammaproteobacteria bacterium]
MSDQNSLLALQPGYELHWYRIERVLGQGAFGITYLAHDVNLDRKVAIKEYLPGQFSVRDTDLTVKPTTNLQKEDFDWGLKRFISEARTLTKFEHPNLVRVFNVFEMNNTAYMVMNYELGKSLQQILKTRKSLNENEITKILFPLMDGLEIMHAKGFVHRDIKPGNVFIRGDGSPVLLDFGSARQTRATPGRDGHEDPKTLTTLVSPGYAPIEQYGSKSDRQGPWTDIYGLGATIYRAITGLMPVAAADRGEAIVHDSKDPYLPVSEAYSNQFSRPFLMAIDHAMAFKATDRPQSIADWRKDFGDLAKDGVTAKRAPATGDDSDMATERLNETEEATLNLDVKTAKLDGPTTAPTVKHKPARNWLTAVLLLGAAALGVGLGFALLLGGSDKAADKVAPPLAEAPQPTPAVTEPQPQPEPFTGQP